MFRYRENIDEIKKTLKKIIFYIYIWFYYGNMKEIQSKLKLVKNLYIFKLFNLNMKI